MRKREKEINTEDLGRGREPRSVKEKKRKGTDRPGRERESESGREMTLERERADQPASVQDTPGQPGSARHHANDFLQEVSNLRPSLQKNPTSRLSVQPPKGASFCWSA